MKYIIYIILFIIIIILLSYKKIYEKLSNKYLYPLQDLQEICNKKGLEPSYLPQVCYKADGTFDPYSNCECIDKNGVCATCYKPITRYELNAGVIYDSNDDVLEEDKIKNNVTIKSD